MAPLLLPVMLRPKVDDDRPCRRWPRSSSSESLFSSITAPPVPLAEAAAASDDVVAAVVVVVVLVVAALLLATTASSERCAVAIPSVSSSCSKSHASRLMRSCKSVSKRSWRSLVSSWCVSRSVDDEAAGMVGESLGVSLSIATRSCEGELSASGGSVVVVGGGGGGGGGLVASREAYCTMKE